MYLLMYKLEYFVEVIYGMYLNVTVGCGVHYDWSIQVMCISPAVSGSVALDHYIFS